MRGMTSDTLIHVPKIPTAQFLLRTLVPPDAPALQRNANNPNVARNLFEGFPQPYTMDDAVWWSTTGSHLPEFGHVWGIEIDGEIAGVVGGRQDAGWLRCNFEIGYWLGEPYWGRGIMREAVGAVTDWVWANLPEVTRIYAPIFSWNEPSMRVLAANGYTREGELKQSAIKDGRVIDRVLWAKVRPAL